LAIAAATPVIPISPIPRAPAGRVGIGDIGPHHLDPRHVHVNGDVVLGEAGVHDPPGPFVELGFLHEREADPHDDPAAELAGGGLGIDDATAVIGPERAVDARLAGDRVDADLAEDRAVECIERDCVSAGSAAEAATVSSSRPARRRICA
jgi:hypothetical protein